MTTYSWTRIAAIIRKEHRDYRRNRFIVLSMSIMPVVFIALPMVQIFTLPASAGSPQITVRIGLSLFYLLIIPTVLPSTLSSYAVVGERDQGTLEPLLITPIRREEFLIGKVLAALVPTLAIAYLIFGIFFAAAALFAQPTVASTIFDRSHLLVLLLFTPLLAGWAIWVGIAISVRSSDVRMAQQLAVLASLPPLAVVALMSFQVIAPTLALALGLAGLLLVIDGFGWWAVASVFDRERLVVGGRA